MSYDNVKHKRRIVAVSLYPAEKDLYNRSVP